MSAGLNWREIDAVLAELELAGSFIRDVRQPVHQQLIFELYAPRRRRFWLLVSFAPRHTRLHRLAARPAALGDPQRFVAFMRAHVRGGRISAALQVGQERIVKLAVARAGAPVLIWLRLWGNAANCIVTRPDGHVLDALLRRPRRGEISGGDYHPERDLEQLRPQAEQLRPEPEQLRTEPEQLRTEPEQLRTEPEQLRTEPEQLRTEPEQLRTEPEPPRTEPEPPRIEPEPPRIEPEPPRIEPEQLRTEPEPLRTEPEQLRTEPEPPHIEPEPPHEGREQPPPERKRLQPEGERPRPEGRRRRRAAAGELPLRAFGDPADSYNLRVERHFAALEAQKRTAAAERSAARARAGAEQRLQRLVQRLERELSATTDHERLRQLGNLLLANLTLIEPAARWVTVDDHYTGGETEIELTPHLAPAANAEAYFTRARRLQRRQAAAGQRLQQARAELAALQAATPTAPPAAPQSPHPQPAAEAPRAVGVPPTTDAPNALGASARSAAAEVPAAAAPDTVARAGQPGRPEAPESAANAAFEPAAKVGGVAHADSSAPPAAAPTGAPAPPQSARPQAVAGPARSAEAPSITGSPGAPAPTGQPAEPPAAAEPDVVASAGQPGPRAAPGSAAPHAVAAAADPAARPAPPTEAIAPGGPKPQAAAQPELAPVPQAGAALPQGVQRQAAAQSPAAARARAPGGALVLASGPFTLLVGRTARQNDDLLRRARGNDYWLHCRDYPGAHVFVRHLAAKSVPLETLLDAGNLAVFFSKARSSGRADVYYTQVKHLRRPRTGGRGAAGAGRVIPTRERNLFITLDQARIDRLLHTPPTAPAPPTLQLVPDRPPPPDRSRFGADHGGGVP